MNSVLDERHEDVVGLERNVVFWRILLCYLALRTTTAA